jgi:hypothetical protein
MLVGQMMESGVVAVAAEAEEERRETSQRIKKNVGAAVRHGQGGWDGVFMMLRFGLDLRCLV